MRKINEITDKLNKNSIVVLREPSLGPVFGRKGGAWRKSISCTRRK